MRSRLLDRHTLAVAILVTSMALASVGLERASLWILTPSKERRAK